MARPKGRKTDGMGTLVRDLRHAKGLSLAQLSEATGIDTGNLSKLESGKGPAAPRLDTIKSIAKALGVRPGLLVDAAV